MVIYKVKIDWKIDKNDPRIPRASIKALNLVGDKCVAVARKETSHPNWKTRTGAARGSVGVAQRPSSKTLELVWGSTGIAYGKWLEFGRGPWMRQVGARVYPDFAEAFRLNLNV